MKLDEAAIRAAYDRGYRVNRSGLVVHYSGTYVMSTRATKGYKTFMARMPNEEMNARVSVGELHAYQVYKAVIFESDVSIRHLDGDEFNNAFENIVVERKRRLTEIETYRLDEVLEILASFSKLRDVVKYFEGVADAAMFVVEIVPIPTPASNSPAESRTPADSPESASQTSESQTPASQETESRTPTVSEPAGDDDSWLS